MTVLDLDTRKLARLIRENGRIVTLMSLIPPTSRSMRWLMRDLLIGAVLIPAAKAPIVVSKKMVARMQPGSVIVDIAIDQGGCIETIRPTLSMKNPTLPWLLAIHYAVPNMPALVGWTSTMGLSRKPPEPFVAMMVQKASSAHSAKYKGLVAWRVNTRNGRITYEAAKAVDLSADQAG